MEQNRTKINKERLLKALESSLGVITTALKATESKQEQTFISG